MVLAIGVVGWHNAGKTRFIEGLLRALKRRGLRVATIKHAHGAVEVDHPGTDTWRFAQAGSDLVIIAGENLLAWMERPTQAPTLDDLLARLPADVQVAIVEGYKQSALPKFEVLREGAGDERIAPPEQLLAFVAEGTIAHSPGVPCIAPDDAEGAIAILIAKGLLPNAEGNLGTHSP
ncbi:MAG: molybdopterin-guanine dinucleotide biosynthesis protein B [Chloroflexi bacterium]|nr:molybdopterin-guanine dinucleotide biosynthesis protein B [Chloroflexota bacterium]